MKDLRRYAVLLTLMVMCGAVAFAQDSAPKPKQAPPRVPFSAFRVKPILEPQLDKEKKDAPAPESKKEKPRPPLLTVKPIVSPSNKPKDAQAIKAVEDIILAPQPAPMVPAPTTQTITSAQTHIPIPPPKPFQRVEPLKNFNLVDRILAQPMEEPEPVAPAVTEKIDSEVQDQTPAKTTVRIRDRGRFDSKQRTAGMSLNSGRIASLGLPKDMQNLRLGRLEEGDGVSPVLMPGRTVTMAAPDSQRLRRDGIPNEVIVFFQENSAELEVGQMDVIGSDVLGAMRDRADLELEIIGYSEPQKGGSEVTEKMALSRALMIREYLVRQDISADRLTVKGKGDDTGIEPRDRVEMFFSR